MSQPTDEAEDPELEHARLVEHQNRPILNQLDRIEATLDGVAEILATDAEEPVT
jgi:hypothetical protein